MWRSGPERTGRKRRKNKQSKSHSCFVICTHAAGEIALVTERRRSAIWGRIQRGKLILPFQSGRRSFLESQLRKLDSHSWDTRKKKQKIIENRLDGKSIHQSVVKTGRMAKNSGQKHLSVHKEPRLFLFILFYSVVSPLNKNCSIVADLCRVMSYFIVRKVSQGRWS